MVKNPDGKKHQYDFIWERRQAVLVLLRRGIEHKKIHQLLQEKYDGPCLKTITNDVKAIRNLQVKLAADLFGDQKKAVADYVAKTLDLRYKALDSGDLRLVQSIDKDLLKLVGVNLDRIEVAFDFGKGAGSGPMSFIEMVNEVRSQKQLIQVTEDEL